MKITIVDTEKDVVETLCREIEILSNDSIRDKNIFQIGLSGGSLVKYLATGLPSIETDWTKWQLFFCDERYVSENDPDSTYGAYKLSLLEKTPLKETQFVIADTSLPLNKCADDYENKIRKLLCNSTSNHQNNNDEHQQQQLTDKCNNKIPEFDLLLLGMGPDGHTCSLFPGHSLLKETQKLVAAIDDSPKPPLKRITMTFPLINNAKCCLFAIAGSSKAEMVKKVFLDREPLPAGMVYPINGCVRCIFDKEAGVYLKDKLKKT